MPPSPPPASPYSRVVPNQAMLTFESIQGHQWLSNKIWVLHNNSFFSALLHEQAVEKRTTKLMSACEISYTTTTKWPNLFFFALIVHESWFPILEIQPSPVFFHRDSAQPFGVKWSKFSQEPRTATELEMVVSCLISPSSSVLPPSPMCMSPLLSWLFKGWLHCSGFELSLPGTFEWVCACQEGAGRAVSFNPRQMENFDMGDARMKLYGHIAAGNKTRQ